jgi:hypothetical protein
MLYTFIREVLGSHLSETPAIPRYFVVLLSVSRKILEQYPN